jgi:hypothetical protein
MADIGTIKRTDGWNREKKKMKSNSLAYRPCIYCGTKPKAEKLDGFGWMIDHYCKDALGTVHLGTVYGLSSMIRFWNEKQAEMEKSA